MVYVNAPPKMCLYQHEFTEDNETVEMRCSGTGIPTPTITWYREAEQMANTNSANHTIEDEMAPDNPYLVSSTLTLSGIGNEDVLGYRCSVINENGVTQKTFRVRRKLKCRCLSRLLKYCVPLDPGPEELEVKVAETKNKLAVDKSQLTGTVTKLISRNDDRPSSFLIGAVGVGILATVGVLLIAFDLIGHFIINPQLHKT
ncbi:uncharacterized protein LOC117329999 [Pecten maximus]|uniref:uncharacterized protein LOC117329999 n=1 Tax=Pecten maximus TaxID=6579 RepID=UPI001458E9F3|nr:uncharacterized protein LOC117329999 [Pecten maximus]